MHYEFPRYRFGECSDPLLAEKFRVLDNDAIKELKSFPTLFAYEGNTENMRVGYLRRIKQLSETIYIEYEFEPRIAEIPFSKIANLTTKLDIDVTGQVGEFDRTHWAVKNENLFEILFEAGLIDQAFLNSTGKPGSIELNPKRSDISTPEWQPERPFVPRILIMKGGGIKGIAFVGALEILEKYGYKFDHFVGTSAGAITAALLAFGHTTEGIKCILEKTSFNDFKDGWFSLPKKDSIFAVLRSPISKLLLPFWILLLPFTKGLYEGEEFKEWLEEHLREKRRDLQNASDIRFEHLSKEKRLTIFSSIEDRSFYEFDSRYPRISGGNRTEKIAFACRCSMAIPYFFKPEKIGGEFVVDGGIQNNYPVYALRDFLRRVNEEPNDFLGLYLGYRGIKKRRRLLFPTLMSFLSEARDVEAKDTFIDRTIVIDPSPISTIDFSLTPKERDFLIAEGKASALDWIFHWADGEKPTDTEVTDAKKLSETLREEVIKERRIRFWTKFGIYSILFFLIIVIGYCVYSYYLKPNPSTKPDLKDDQSSNTSQNTQTSNTQENDQTKTIPVLPDNAWAIAIEGDQDINSAKEHLKDLAKKNGYQNAYIFYRATENKSSRYRTVIIFSKQDDADNELQNVQKIKSEITSVKDMVKWCPNPKWEKEYFVCGMTPLLDNENSNKELSKKAPPSMPKETSKPIIGNQNIYGLSGNSLQILPELNIAAKLLKDEGIKDKTVFIEFFYPKDENLTLSYENLMSTDNFAIATYPVNEDARIISLGAMGSYGVKVSNIFPSKSNSSIVSTVELRIVTITY
jgi:predicted acylesterase/phospholipase RssA